MKEQFDKESRQALVNYRYQRSVDTMREAEVRRLRRFYLLYP